MKIEHQIEVRGRRHWMDYRSGDNRYLFSKTLDVPEGTTSLLGMTTQDVPIRFDPEIESFVAYEVLDIGNPGIYGQNSLEHQPEFVDRLTSSGYKQKAVS